MIKRFSRKALTNTVNANEKNRKERTLVIGVVDAMKTLKEIKKELEILKPLLGEQYGVETIGVFGSYTRGEQTQKSDVDILVTFFADAKVGFFKFLELEEFLAKNLGVKVDLVTKDALKPYIKDRILRETVYA